MPAPRKSVTRKKPLLSFPYLCAKMSCREARPYGTGGLRENFQKGTIMIRAIFGILFVVLYCIVSIPILLVETLIRKRWPLKAEMSMLRIVQGAFRILLRITGTTVTVKGLENIPGDEAVLFVGNHQSFFDIIISYSQMKTRCGYIAKDNLEHIPLLSWNMKFLFCLFLNRDDLKQGLETIKKAISYIENGISVFVFIRRIKNRGRTIRTGKWAVC